MFGILFFVFIALCGGLYAIRNGINDVRIYKDTKDDFNGYYIDSLGRKKEIGTGNQIYILSDDYGDDIMYTPRGRFMKNITEIKRHKFIDAIQNYESNSTAYWCDLRAYHENEWRNIDGPRYSDKETKNIYVVRDFDIDGFKFRKRNHVSGMMETIIRKESISFYMDITNGHLIRPTDGCFSLQKQYEQEENYMENNKQVIESFVDDFNHKQDIDIQNKNVDGFDSHFFFNSHSSCDTVLDHQWYAFCKNEGKLELIKEDDNTTWSH